MFAIPILTNDFVRIAKPFLRVSLLFLKFYFFKIYYYFSKHKGSWRAHIDVAANLDGVQGRDLYSGPG